jgi:hypothetical protein
MNITLGTNSEAVLARYFAEQIHAMLIRQHLGASQAHSVFRGLVRDERIEEIRAAIRSIADPLARRQFITFIRVLFADLKKAHGTPHTTRAFLAGIAAQERRAA